MAAATDTDNIPRAARVAHANLSRSQSLLTQVSADLARLSARDLAGLFSMPEEAVELVITLRTSVQDGAHVTSVLRGVQGGKTLALQERKL